MSKGKVVSQHPRPFQLYYAESPRVQVHLRNYSARSRCSTFSNALQAAVRRMHWDLKLSRVDIYDAEGIMHMGNVRRTKSGFIIDMTSYAYDQFNAELRTTGQVWKY